MSTIHEAVRTLEGFLAGDIVPPACGELREQVWAHYDADPSYFFPSWAAFHVGNVEAGFIAGAAEAGEALGALLDQLDTITGDAGASALATRLRVLGARERDERDRHPARVRAREYRQRASELERENPELAQRLRDFADREEQLATIAGELEEPEPTGPTPEEVEALNLVNRYAGPGVAFFRDPDGRLFGLNVLEGSDGKG